GGAPPTIILKVHDSTQLDDSCKRYPLGFLREVTPIQQVPIRLILRGRNDTDPDVIENKWQSEEEADIADSREAEQLEAAAVEAEGNVEDFVDEADTEVLTVIHQDMEDLDEPAPNFFDSDVLPDT
ncbi:MAG: hypothetical protein ACK58L_12210, partial [Planctomycetota bacterium]